MIISRVPRPLHAWRPLLVPVAVLLLWDIGVTTLYLNQSTHFDGIDIQFTLFGSAIALFIGFMVNASYERWWEARTLWGQIVNSSRSLSRQVLVLADETVPGARADLRTEIVRAQVAYANVLRTSLRDQELPEEAGRYLSIEALAAVRMARNRHSAVLTGIDHTVTEAVRRGMIGELSRLQIEDTLVALTDAHGGLERIKNTPLPVQYRFLPRFFARAFCVILPFAVVADLGWVTPIGSGLVSLMFLLAVQIGDELADPFADTVYDIPMTALCRTIEIDLIQMIGADPPPQVVPIDRVLW